MKTSLIIAALAAALIAGSTASSQAIPVAPLGKSIQHNSSSLVESVLIRRGYRGYGAYRGYGRVGIHRGYRGVGVYGYRNYGGPYNGYGYGYGNGYGNGYSYYRPYPAYAPPVAYYQPPVVYYPPPVVYYPAPAVRYYGAPVAYPPDLDYDGGPGYGGQY